MLLLTEWRHADCSKVKHPSVQTQRRRTSVPAQTRHNGLSTTHEQKLQQHSQLARPYNTAETRKSLEQTEANALARQDCTGKQPSACLLQRRTRRRHKTPRLRASDHEMCTTQCLPGTQREQNQNQHSEKRGKQRKRIPGDVECAPCSRCTARSSNSLHSRGSCLGDRENCLNFGCWQHDTEAELRLCQLQISQQTREEQRAAIGRPSSLIPSRRRLAADVENTSKTAPLATPVGQARRARISLPSLAERAHVPNG